jgi:glutamate carboxypeptidase
MESRQIYKHFETRLDPILAFMREIVEIESPSHNCSRSSDVVALIESKIREIGHDIVVERSTVDDGEHLIIRAFPRRETAALILGHTDTVHPLGSTEINPTRIESDVFYGCGIFDMKANIVIAVEALRYFTETGQRPRRPVTILLSCDEEVGSHTGRPIVEREAANAAYCLVMEPSADGMVKTGRKGTGMYTLSARGRPAHAGLEPDKGANAIVELARQIPVIHAIGGDDQRTTVNVTKIKGGTTSNVIPEFAECEIDVRFRSNEEASRVDDELHRLSPFDARVVLELTGGINRPPMERTPEVVELFEKARDLAASFGYELEETQVGGASDGNFVAALGIPLIDGLGVRGSGAHMMTENINVSDIVPRATLITLLLQNL